MTCRWTRQGYIISLVPDLLPDSSVAFESSRIIAQYSAREVHGVYCLTTVRVD